MADVLVRNVPDAVLEGLKRRAAERRRSLQGELLEILEAAARPSREEHAQFAAEMRERLARTGRSFSNSVDLIREDRDR